MEDFLWLIYIHTYIHVHISDAIGNLGDFDGMKMQSLTKEGLKFGDEDEDTLKKRLKAYRESFKPLTTYLKTLFEGKLGKVTVSQRVEKTPAIIVTSQYGHTANMERIMRAQTFANPEVSSRQCCPVYVVRC